jgi:hypothetical protein
VSPPQDDGTCSELEGDDQGGRFWGKVLYGCLVFSGLFVLSGVVFGVVFGLLWAFSRR